MKIFKFSVVALAGLALVGCQEVRKEDVGTITCGVLGGVLGSNVGKGSGNKAAIIAGTLLGAYLGGSIGRTMDKVDQYEANQAFETLPDKQTKRWKNPNTGNEYAVTPTKTVQTASSDCREYEMEAWIDGKRETVVGTACRDAQGRWQTSN
jgi:surface antigen